MKLKSLVEFSIHYIESNDGNALSDEQRYTVLILKSVLKEHLKDVGFYDKIRNTGGVDDYKEVLKYLNTYYTYL